MQLDAFSRRGALGAFIGSALSAETLKAAPIQAKDPSQDHQARDLPGQTALAVSQDPHQRRHRRPRRADPRRPRAHLPGRHQGDRALPGRQGPAPRRAPLAGDLPPRLLPRRPDPHQRPQRHRPGALGHQGQGARRARLRAARRPHARPGPRLRARRRTTPSAIKEAPGAGLHRLQDRPGQAAPGAHTSKPRPLSTTPAEHFAELRASSSATKSTSASTSTAPSAPPHAKC